MLVLKRPLPPTVLILAGFFAFWMGLVALFAAQIMLATGQLWPQTLRGSLILWTPWMAVSPLMLLAAHLLPIGGTRLRWLVPGHLLISAALLFMAGWLSRNVMPMPDHASEQAPSQTQVAQPPPQPQLAQGAYAGQPPPPQPQGDYPAGDYPPLHPGDPGYGPPRPGDLPPGVQEQNGQFFGPNGRPLRVGPNGLPLPPNQQGGPQPAPPTQPTAPAQVQAASPSLLDFFRTLPVGLPLYLASLFLVGSLDLRRISLEKERRAIELEKQLADVRLETLRAQLHPHFLFNTLNALMSLVHSDPAKAEEMILCLSSLLRATLETKDKPRIPLRDELQLAHDYLSIQSLRYGNRLQTNEAMLPETLACMVPPLILQPILENAIKYAIDRHAAGGTINLRAERLGEKLIIEIEDSGSGRNAEARESHGVGVANVRARLAASFPGREVGFDLLPNHFGGITVRFQVPVTAEKDDGALLT